MRLWRYFWLLAVIKITAAVAPDGLRDLGSLTPETEIPLLRNTARDDFSHFEIEVCSSLDTNRVVKFTTTNDFLDLSHFTALPSGRLFLGIKSISTAGQESAVSLFTFSIWRADKLPPPQAGTVVLHRHRSRTNRIGEGSDSLMRAFGRLRARSTQPVVVPPLPPGLRNRMEPPPLPGGRPETYADRLDAEAEQGMRQFYAKKGRRNE